MGCGVSIGRVFLEDERYYSVHHPFTRPYDEDLHLIDIEL